MLQSLPLSPSRDASPARYGGRFLDSDFIPYDHHLGSYLGGPSSDLRRDDFQDGKHQSVMDRKKGIYMSDSSRGNPDSLRDWERRTSFPAESPVHGYARVCHCII